MKFSQFLSRVISLLLLLSFITPVVKVQAQDDIPSVRARALLNILSPEEKIGQLFLMTFNGSSVDASSQIHDLITEHHIGGVILSASNDNFGSSPETISDAFQLIRDIQSFEWEDSQQTLDPITGNVQDHRYIPLLIGISQEGDGFPNDQIIDGVTTLPSQMAIGATWQPSLAELSGQVMGRELAAIGFNLYFGLSLDVLESPTNTGGAELGTRTFGGDPYWVGTMGQAFIRGLHKGSDNSLIVVSKHFPGRGSADRLSSSEAATVRKRLEQLEQIELAPFFAVTGDAPDAESRTDALFVSHIRYQGFQGNIRATTKPVSLDASALTQIMSLPSFDDWRRGGGLVISDDLSSPAIRRFYDPGGLSFVAKSVARDAFLAGNDILYLGNIVSTDSADTYSTVLTILDFFVQKYNEDPAFAQRVDESVERILTKKYELYINFLPTLVNPSADEMMDIGTSQSITFEIARQAATLISPDLEDLGTILPTAPDLREVIVFLTDDRLAKQCSTCIEEPVMAVDALQRAVLRLYGPNAGGEVIPGRLASYTFSELELILPGEDGLEPLESALQQTDWIVISMLDIAVNLPQSHVLYRFLSEREDLIRNKRIVLFAFGAPYYLDATDISKLSAYYGLYGKSENFLDVAARLLFQEITPIGALPVSVPGIGYDLLSATAPDPQQVIELSLDLPPAPTPASNETPAETPLPVILVGDSLTVRTGIIQDHNNNPVPDGTGVRFTITFSGESGIIQQYEETTVDGIARVTFAIERPGLLEVRAISEPATTSVVLQLDVTGEGVNVTVVPPTASQESITPFVITPTAVVVNETAIERGVPGFGGWLIAIVMLGGGTMLIFWGISRNQNPQLALRWSLAGVIGGLGAYNYIALGMPGGAGYIQKYRYLGIVLIVLAGTVLGVLLAWIMYRFSANRRKNKADQQ